MALSSSCVSTSEVMSNEGMTCFYAEARAKGIRNPQGWRIKILPEASGTFRVEHATRMLHPGAGVAHPRNFDASALAVSARGASVHICAPAKCSDLRTVGVDGRFSPAKHGQKSGVFELFFPVGWGHWHALAHALLTGRCQPADPAIAPAPLPVSAFRQMGKPSRHQQTNQHPKHTNETD
jgi:hypothetical protein